MIKEKFPKFRKIKFKERKIFSGDSVPSLKLFRVAKINIDKLKTYFLNGEVILKTGVSAKLLLTFSEKVARRLYDNLKEIFESNQNEKNL